MLWEETKASGPKQDLKESKDNNNAWNYHTWPLKSILALYTVHDPYYELLVPKSMAPTPKHTNLCYTNHQIIYIYQSYLNISFL